MRPTHMATPVVTAGWEHSGEWFTVVLYESGHRPYGPFLLPLHRKAKCISGPIRWCYDPFITGSKWQIWLSRNRHKLCFSLCQESNSIPFSKFCQLQRLLFWGRSCFSRQCHWCNLLLTGSLLVPFPPWGQPHLSQYLPIYVLMPPFKCVGTAKGKWGIWAVPKHLLPFPFVVAWCLAHLQCETPETAGGMGHWWPKWSGPGGAEESEVVWGFCCMGGTVLPLCLQGLIPGPGCTLIWDLYWLLTWSDGLWQIGSPRAHWCSACKTSLCEMGFLRPLWKAWLIWECSDVAPANLTPNARETSTKRPILHCLLHPKTVSDFSISPREGCKLEIQTDGLWNPYHAVTHSTLSLLCTEL